MSYANRLRSEIDRIGVTELARNLGSARNTIYNWCEKGNIPLDKLMLLSEFGVDINYILTGTKDQAALTAEETILVQKYRFSDQNTKKNILLMLLTGTDATGSVVNSPTNSGSGTQLNGTNPTINNAAPSNSKDVNGNVSIKARGKHSQAAFNIKNE